MNNRSIPIYTTLSGLWLVAGCAVLSAVDIEVETTYLAYILLMLTTIVALADPFRYAGLVVGLLSAGIYTVVLSILRPLGQTLILPAVFGAVVFVGDGLLAGIISEHVHKLFQELDQNRKMLDNLRIQDPETGLMRQSFAQQAIQNEALRFQRYHSHFCLLLIKLVGQDQTNGKQAAANRKNARQRVGQILASGLRATDQPFNNTNFGVILPETRVEEGLIVAQRVLTQISAEVRIQAHGGIAQFGLDAGDEEELFRAAETALNLAITTGEQIVRFYALPQSVQVG